MDDLASLVVEERFGPPPLRDPAGPLAYEHRQALREIIAVLARALDIDDIARHTRRRAAARDRWRPP